jgi:hypothetical protein
VLSVKVGWVPGNDFRGCGSQSRGIDFDFFNWCFLQDDIVLVLVFLIGHYGSCILSRVFSALVCLLCLFYLSSCTLSLFFCDVLVASKILNKDWPKLACVHQPNKSAWTQARKLRPRYKVLKPTVLSLSTNLSPKTPSLTTILLPLSNPPRNKSVATSNAETPNLLSPLSLLFSLMDPHLPSIKLR